MICSDFCYTIACSATTSESYAGWLHQHERASYQNYALTHKTSQYQAQYEKFVFKVISSSVLHLF